MARKTIRSLEIALAEVSSTSEARSKMIHDTRAAKAAAEESEKETREQFADLKKRLHRSEMEVARLNGYLARVREDDTVREELVTTGEPGGEQRLTPKRKPEYLGNTEDDYSGMKSSDPMMHYLERDRKKPKHWIEY